MQQNSNKIGTQRNGHKIRSSRLREGIKCYDTQKLKCGKVNKNNS